MWSQQNNLLHPKQIQFDDKGQQWNLSEGTQPPHERIYHVQIWDSNVNTCTSNEFNAISNVIGSTGIHTFHIIAICIQNNYACYIKYVCPIYLQLYSIYWSHNTAHLSQNKKNCNFIYHAISICGPATYMPLRCHLNTICKNYLTQ